jgi:GT2 family glycosyltransferase
VTPAGDDVTAVIVSYVDVAATERAVDSLLGGTSRPERVVVVHNGPPAERLDGLAGRERVEVVRPGRNLGFAPAVELAAGRADTEWLLLLNPDARAEPDCLERLLEAAEPDVAIAGAQVLLPDGRVNAGDNPVHLSGLCWAGRYGQPAEDGPPRDTLTVSGAAMLVRRSAFAALGGFAPGSFLYYEDTDLAWRARLAGWRVRFVPRARVWHDYEFEKGAGKWFGLERNRTWAVLSNYEAGTLLLLAPLLVATELAIAAQAAAQGWLGAKLRAWAALARDARRLVSWRRRVQGARTVPDARLLREFAGAIETPMLASPWLRAANRALVRYHDAVVAARR